MTKNQDIRHEGETAGKKYKALVMVLEHAHANGWKDDRPISPYLSGLQYARGEMGHFMRRAIRKIDSFFYQGLLREGRVISWLEVRHAGMLYHGPDCPHRVDGQRVLPEEY